MGGGKCYNSVHSSTPHPPNKKKFNAPDDGCAVKIGEKVKDFNIFKN
jgi:hypothetical protein